MSADRGPAHVNGICVPVDTERCNAGSFFFYGTGRHFVANFGVPHHPFDESDINHTLSRHYDRRNFLVHPDAPLPNRKFRGTYFHVSKDNLRVLLPGSRPALELACEIEQVPGRLIAELASKAVISEVGRLKGKEYVEFVTGPFARFPQAMINRARDFGVYGASHLDYNPAGLPARNGQVTSSV